jgi:hypothetical protein
MRGALALRGVCLTSAYPPIAVQKRTRREVGATRRRIVARGEREDRMPAIALSDCVQ